MAKKTAEPATETPEAPAPEVAAAPEPLVAKKKAAPADGSNKKKKQPGIPPHRGKKLTNHLKNQQSKLNKEGAVPVKRAISLLKTMKRVKFDETVEVHMHLGIDPAQNDQNVRGSVTLPYGVGKTVRVIVFCQADDVTKAKEAGADLVGADEVIKKVQDGWTDFDVALATQSMMGQVSRLGKVLGPRGLMPTPKAGTVIPAGGDVAKAVQEFKAGKVEYRSDKGGNVHAGVGKLSFEEEKLASNIQAFVEQVRASKPSGVKGHFIQSVTVSATMSPGIAVTA
jgi:large subunit ribosomal protein L1